MNNKILVTLPALVALTVLCCRKGESVKRPSASPEVLREHISQSTPSTSPQEDHSLSPPPTASRIEEQSLPQTRRRIIDEITRLIGSQKGGFTKEHWRILKNRYWRPGFDDVARRADDTSTILQLLSTPKDKEQLITQIATGRFTDVHDNAEKESLLAFHLLAIMTAYSGGGGSLPNAFEQRQDMSEITRGDVYMFVVFNDAFADVPRGDVTQTDLDQWKSMAKSSNGLQRLLALRTFQRVGSNRKQWLDFYQNYLAEPDQGILEEVCLYAYMTALPEAANLLLEIRDRSDIGKNSNFVTKLNERIVDLQTRQQSEK